MNKCALIKAIFLLTTFLAATMLPLSHIVKGSTQNTQKAIYLIIKTDGSIEPQTSLLDKNGLKYTFNEDIYGTIWVQKEGITLEGAGHTLKGTSLPDNKGIILAGPDLSHRNCKYVTVKNLKMVNSKIYTVGGSNNTITGNYLEYTDILIQSNYNITGNLIKHNTLINTGILVDYNRYGIDTITENNFYNSKVDYALSDPPILDSNYWNNYKTLYPNAKEIDNIGIWDTPYAPENPYEGIYSATDSHPLVNPIEDFSSYFSLPLEPIPTPTPIQTPTPTPSPDTEFPTYIVLASVSILSIVGIGILVYFKKFRRKY